MKDCKFIIQYGERVDIEGWYQFDKVDRMPRILWPIKTYPVPTSMLFVTGSLKHALDADNLDEYDAVFISKPASPYRKHRQDGTEFIWGDNGCRLVEVRDGRIYHTWYGSNDNIPEKYLTPRWRDIIELNKTKTIKPKSYRNLLPMGLFGLIDMVEYIESVSDKPLHEMMACEIGTYQGAAAGVFATAFGQLVTVDPWLRRGKPMEDVKAVWIENMERFGNVEPIEWESLKAAGSCPNNYYDFIYIDADHSEEAVTADIRAWLPKLKPDGFLCGHDFPGRNHGVEIALRATVGLPDKTFADNSWVIQYKKGVRV